MSRSWLTSTFRPNPPEREIGRARQLCPGTSDIDFGDLKRVVDLDVEVAYRAEFVSIEAAE
jgi:hypothetical protein